MKKPEPKSFEVHECQKCGEIYEEKGHARRCLHSHLPHRALRVKVEAVELPEGTLRYKPGDAFPRAIIVENNVTEQTAIYVRLPKGSAVGTFMSEDSRKKPPVYLP